MRTLKIAAALALGVTTIAGASAAQHTAVKHSPAKSGAATNMSAPAATSATVKIDNFTFNPAAVTVKVGATVKWINGDDIPHTVVAKDKSFKSTVLDTGGQFSFTFTKVGQFEYFCSIHPRMTGRIIVVK
jgi:plastocyanin